VQGWTQVLPVDWDDDNDHGTHCAGTAGAIDNSEGVVGVSSQATLHAVKVLDKRGSGTSMSCPHVAGAAGLLIDAGYAPTEVRSRLASTAEDVGYGGNETGAGLLDAAAALGLDSSDDS
jgi:subtilisin family serine protease